MNAAPRISRIVTIYNQWNYLEWLADDALFTPETEYIIVDDCSESPAPAAIIAHLADRRITLLRLPRNQGRCVARNTGAERAHGEFIDFIDGDDRPLPVAVHGSWSHADVVCFPFEVHGIAHDARTSWVRHPLLEDPRAAEGFLDPRPAAVLWRRRAFLEIGGFDPRFECAEDLDLCLRALDLPRAYCAVPKQSYNEQRRTDFTEIACAAARLVVHRRLPATNPLRNRLVSDDLRALHLQVTWRLLRSGERHHLFRASLALLRNLLKWKTVPTKTDNQC